LSFGVGLHAIDAIDIETIGSAGKSLASAIALPALPGHLARAIIDVTFGTGSPAIADRQGLSAHSGCGIAFGYAVMSHAAYSFRTIRIGAADSFRFA